jgi:hypothetical protein
MVEKPPKINEISLRLSTEYLRLFAIECIHRATQVAQQEEEEEEAQQEEEEKNPQNPANQTADENLRSALKGLIQVRPPSLLIALSLFLIEPNFCLLACNQPTIYLFTHRSASAFTKGCPGCTARFLKGREVIGVYSRKKITYVAQNKHMKLTVWFVFR